MVSVKDGGACSNYGSTTRKNTGAGNP